MNIIKDMIKNVKVIKSENGYKAYYKDYELENYIIAEAETKNELNKLIRKELNNILWIRKGCPCQ